MKNFVLGVLVALTCSSWAITKNENGSILLSQEEAQAIGYHLNQMETNLNLAITTLQDLSTAYDQLKKNKCT